MKQAIIISLLVIVAAGCTQSENPLQGRINNADSIAINYFKGDGSMDTVVAVKIIRDSVMMQQLTTLVTQQQVAYKASCGYDGSLHFFKNNQVLQDIYFSLSQAGCMQFSFLQQGRQVATALSPEAEKILRAVQSK